MGIRSLVAPARRTTVFLAVALAMLIGGATPAMAAHSQDVWYAVSVTLYDLESDKEPTMVIAALAREGTELPIEAAIAIPKGVTLSWVGEVMGGDSSQDPTLEYTRESGTDYDVINFTMQYSLLAQIEMTAPEGALERTDFTAEVDLGWTSGGLVDRARIGIAAPMGTHMEDVTPEPTIEVRPADVLYSVETSPVAAGTTIAISGTVAPGMAPEVEVPEAEPDLDSMTATEVAPAATQTDEVDEAEPVNTTWVIVGVLAAIIGVLVVVIIGRTRKTEG